MKNRIFFLWFLMFGGHIRHSTAVPIPVHISGKYAQPNAQPKQPVLLENSVTLQKLTILRPIKPELPKARVNPGIMWNLPTMHQPSQHFERIARMRSMMTPRLNLPKRFEFRPPFTRDIV